jgi:hypothetical protein
MSTRQNPAHTLTSYLVYIGLQVSEALRIHPARITGQQPQVGEPGIMEQSSLCGSSVLLLCRLPPSVSIDTGTNPTALADGSSKPPLQKPQAAIANSGPESGIMATHCKPHKVHQLVACYRFRLLLLHCTCPPSNRLLLNPELKTLDLTC